MIQSTPSDRFASIPDFPFTPNWLRWGEIDMHYVDEGTGPPVVLLHGEPTWSYLYRHFIPRIVAAGYRAVAPDYPGFGKSQKPTDPAFYSYENMAASMRALADHLDLADATIVVQDWGGPIGLRVATEMPHRFRRLCILNTGLYASGRSPGKGFMAWRRFVEQTPDLPVERILRAAATTNWPDDVIAAYEAPFPTESHKVGIWRLPQIVPLDDADPGATEMMRVTERLARWDGPAAVIFADRDPVFSTRTGSWFANLIPGAGELEVVEGAGHFLQEDAGDEVAGRILAFLARTD